MTYKLKFRTSHNQSDKTPSGPGSASIPIASKDEVIYDECDHRGYRNPFPGSNTAAPPPSVNTENDKPVFITWDEHPEIIGGMSELIIYLKYPAIVLKAEIERTVVIIAVIDEYRQVLETTILKGLGNNGTSEQRSDNSISKMDTRKAKRQSRRSSNYDTDRIYTRLTSD